ncbi:M56 family metallopeptidase [Georgenia satyanarayanai]|uniref:M56 family metallopeptidase n=1 Tax=Georgenia satyanarayanai TaxID=860221 RepID=UPI00203AFF30|nr:M56 family metallopeptidase [Georgenia satyanarayanai]MCM3661374.1 M56 family metallopeptidase [Georgenia satyanarayanai]
MTGVLVVVGLAALLGAGAVAGPRALTRLAPTLTRRPRAGIAAWTGGVTVWVLGLLALGPLLGWLATGPALPGTAGAVCRRCLAATNPFGMPAMSVSLPPAAPILGAALLGTGLLGALALAAVRLRREGTTHVALLSATAERGVVRGTPVWLLPSGEPTAYTLPRAGVVLSRGTVEALDDEQLGAVLAHEGAHLRGRHHLVLGMLRGLRSVLGVVPLVRAAPQAVAAYAEMAADDAALRSHDRRALAGALLALHRPGPAPVGAALHAGTSHVHSRIGRLAAAATPPSRLATAAVAGYLSTVTAAVLLVLGPYATVLVQGAC